MKIKLNNDIQHAYRKDMRAVVDWLSFTLPLPSELSGKLVDSQIFYVFDDVLGIPRTEFKVCKTGLNGYKSRVRFNNISVLFDGTPEMGIHVVMTGQGCRSYEKYCCDKSEKEHFPAGDIWKGLIERINLYSNKYARIDISIDDFKTYFPLGVIASKLWEGICTSLFNDFKVISSGKISSGLSTGLTIYLGSAKSEFQIVAYNKYLERIAAGHELDEGITEWNRFECRHYNDHAKQAARLILEGVPLGTIAHSKIHKYFNVLQPDKKDSNRSRWKLWNKWARFLGAVEKAKGEFVKPDKTLEKTIEYLSSKMNKPMAKAFAVGGERLIEEIIAKGIEKFSDSEIHEIENHLNLNSGGMIEDEDNQLHTEMRRLELVDKKNQPIGRID